MAMKVEKLFIYPIKSLRGSSISSAEIVQTGFKYDRTFLLLKVDEDGTRKNMHISNFSEMCLFTTEIVLPDAKSSDNEESGHIIVTYVEPENTSASKRRIKIPLEPATEGFEVIDIEMHHSAAKCHVMPAHYSDWFSSCFSFPVVLAYLGTNSRPVLGNNPTTSSSFPLSLTPSTSNYDYALQLVLLIYQYLLIFIAPFLSFLSTPKPAPASITFADCAALLTVTTASFDSVASRLPTSALPLDVTKFRPNILFSPSSTSTSSSTSSSASTAFDEDFWTTLTITPTKSPYPSTPSTTARAPITIELTANCSRCRSLDVDYQTGRFVAPEHAILKRLMVDRRVDVGNKYSPVFGRYGFPRDGGVVVVGDVVSVRRTEERSVWEWP